jgi:hypothetical protein
MKRLSPSLVEVFGITMQAGKEERKVAMATGCQGKASQSESSCMKLLSSCVLNALLLLLHP